jgi:predicted outer membrane repeat protein
MRNPSLLVTLALGLSLSLALLWLTDSRLSAHATPTAAAIVYVRTNGHDTNCNGEHDAPASSAPDCAFATIQKGVSSVDPGGVVNVAMGTYTESITITKSLTLRGAGASNTIVDGGDAGRVFAIDGSLTVDIYSVTIQHGHVVTGDWGGGGIRNWGSTLTLANVVVQNNIVDIYDHTDCGGGIHNLGVLSLDNVTISGNSAYRGGGIRSNNVLTITNSVLTSNTASVSGGGVHIYGTAALENVTFSGNTANSGGAVSNNEETTLNHCTIVGNIYNASRSILTFASTIVAGDCDGPAAVTSNGHNLDSGDSCGFTASGDITNTNPLLGPLRDNGGDTFTHSLLNGSPAIDAGADSGCPATDQRGSTRPADGDKDGTATCDIGAYEYLLPVYLPLCLCNYQP